MMSMVLLRSSIQVLEPSFRDTMRLSTNSQEQAAAISGTIAYKHYVLKGRGIK